MHLVAVGLHDDAAAALAAAAGAVEQTAGRSRSRPRRRTVDGLADERLRALDDRDQRNEAPAPTNEPPPARPGLGQRGGVVARIDDDVAAGLDRRARRQDPRRAPAGEPIVAIVVDSTTESPMAPPSPMTAPRGARAGRTMSSCVACARTTTSRRARTTAVSAMIARVVSDATVALTPTPTPDEPADRPRRRRGPGGRGRSSALTSTDWLGAGARREVRPGRPGRSAPR